MLNTIAAQAIDQLSDKLEAQLEGGAETAEAVLAVIKESYAAHKRIVFNGDGYSEEWHKEAEERGLSNLKQTPDALPALVSESAVEVMGDYDVLSERELESRYEVFVEQYVVKLNIEAETTYSIAKTMLLPAAVRYLGELNLAGESPGISAVSDEVRGYLDTFVTQIGALENANTNHPDVLDVLDEAKYVQSHRRARHGGGARDGRHAGAAHPRQPVAAAEVLGDPLRQVVLDPAICRGNLGSGRAQGSVGAGQPGADLPRARQRSKPVLRLVVSHASISARC